MYVCMYVCIPLLWMMGSISQAPLQPHSPEKLFETESARVCVYVCVGV
jgi:hypothetical protein